MMKIQLLKSVNYINLITLKVQSLTVLTIIR
jgi:hypothetical protein